MKIWYARVSTTGQNLDVQIAKLKAAGCDKIFEEKKSGGANTERQQLTDALTYIREGDQFVVTRLDRLARSVRDLSNITKQIDTKQVDLVVLDQKIDTSSPTWRLLFHMLAAIGEFERDLIKERAADGIARAKANGVKFGASRKLKDDDIELLKIWFHRPGTNRQHLAKTYGISRSTLYRLVGDSQPPLRDDETAT